MPTKAGIQHVFLWQQLLDGAGMWGDDNPFASG